MANTTKARQSKLVKLCIAAEETLGDYQTLVSGTPTIPVTALPVPSKRGTQIIGREATLDGFQGAMVGVPGSWGWNISATAELQYGGAGEQFPYFVLMLLASGHEMTTDADTPGVGQNTLTFFPSTKVLADFDAGEANPAPTAVSLSVIENHNQTADTVIRMRGCTGTTSFSFTANEIANITTAFNGLVQNDELLDSTDVNAALLGTFSTERPLIVKDITLSITDAVSGSETFYGLQNLDFNTSFEVPDYLDPTELNGFGISPPILNGAPTVSFSIMDTEDIDQYLADTLKAGTLFALNITLTDGTPTTPNTFTLNLPKCQYTGYTRGDTNGLASFAIDANVVREPGDAFLYSIEYVYTES